MPSTSDFADLAALVEGASKVEDIPPKKFTKLKTELRSLLFSKEASRLRVALEGKPTILKLVVSDWESKIRPYSEGLGKALIGVPEVKFERSLAWVTFPTEHETNPEDSQLIRICVDRAPAQFQTHSGRVSIAPFCGSHNWTDLKVYADFVESIDLASKLASEHADSLVPGVRDDLVIWYELVGNKYVLPALSGASSGLPVYLLLRSVWSNQPLDMDTVSCTGEIKADGQLTQISGLKGKRIACLAAGFSTLIVPLGSTPEDLPEDGVSLKVVSTVEEAWGFISATNPRLTKLAHSLVKVCENHHEEPFPAVYVPDFAELSIRIRRWSDIPNKGKPSTSNRHWVHHAADGSAVVRNRNPWATAKPPWLHSQATFWHSIYFQIKVQNVTVLSGGSGAGKSVALKLAAHYWLQRWLDDSAEPITIFCKATDLAHAIQTHYPAATTANHTWNDSRDVQGVSLTLAQEAVRSCDTLSISDSEWLVSKVKSLIENGQALIMVDGLDECTIDYKLDLLLVQLALSTGSKLILTSRPYAISDEVVELSVKERLYLAEIGRWTYGRLLQYYDIIGKRAVGEALAKSEVAYGRDNVASIPLFATLIARRTEFDVVRCWRLRCNFELLDACIQGWGNLLDASQLARKMWVERAPNGLIMNRIELDMFDASSKKLLNTPWIRRFVRGGADATYEWVHPRLFEFLVAGSLASDASTANLSEDDFLALRFDPRNAEIASLFFQRLLVKCKVEEAWQFWDKVAFGFEDASCSGMFLALKLLVDARALLGAIISPLRAIQVGVFCNEARRVLLNLEDSDPYKDWVVEVNLLEHDLKPTIDLAQVQDWRHIMDLCSQKSWRMLDWCFARVPKRFLAASEGTVLSYEELTRRDKVSEAFTAFDSRKVPHVISWVKEAIARRDNSTLVDMLWFVAPLLPEVVVPYLMGALIGTTKGGTGGQDVREKDHISVFGAHCLAKYGVATVNFYMSQLADDDRDTLQDVLGRMGQSQMLSAQSASEPLNVPYWDAPPPGCFQWQQALAKIVDCQHRYTLWALVLGELDTPDIGQHLWYSRRASGLQLLAQLGDPEAVFEIPNLVNEFVDKVPPMPEPLGAPLWELGDAWVADQLEEHYRALMDSGKFEKATYFLHAWMLSESPVAHRVGTEHFEALLEWDGKDDLPLNDEVEAELEKVRQSEGLRPRESPAAFWIDEYSRKLTTSNSSLTESVARRAVKRAIDARWDVSAADLIRAIGLQQSENKSLIQAFEACILAGNLYKARGFVRALEHAGPVTNAPDLCQFASVCVKENETKLLHDVVVAIANTPSAQGLRQLLWDVIESGTECDWAVSALTAIGDPQLVGHLLSQLADLIENDFRRAQIAARRAATVDQAKTVRYLRELLLARRSDKAHVFLSAILFDLGGSDDILAVLAACELVDDKEAKFMLIELIATGGEEQHVSHIVNVMTTAIRAGNDSFALLAAVSLSRLSDESSRSQLESLARWAILHRPKLAKTLIPLCLRRNIDLRGAMVSASMEMGRRDFANYATGGGISETVDWETLSIVSAWMGQPLPVGMLGTNYLDLSGPKLRDSRRRYQISAKITDQYNLNQSWHVVELAYPKSRAK